MEPGILVAVPAFKTATHLPPFMGMYSLALVGYSAGAGGYFLQYPLFH